jgi:aspartate aminotransferase
MKNFNTDYSNREELLMNTVSVKASKIMASSTLAITSKFKEMKSQGLDVIGFGAGEPDFDTPESIKAAAIDAINKGYTKYTPASGTLELKTAICRKFEKDNNISYKPSQIIVSNGAKHSLTNTFMAICNPGDEVIIPTPFWVSYPEIVSIADGKPVFLETSEENNFKFTVDDLKEVVNKNTKAIILNSPSNPTGMIYSKKELEKIAEYALDNDIYIISDEIYEHLIYDNLEHVSIASLGNDIKEKTIVINGVSKAYSMTGWRIGYTASNEKIAKIMANVQSHTTSNPNSIAQHATVAALNGDQSQVEVMRKAFEERRNYMVDKINSISGLSCLKPEGAFYTFVNISEAKRKGNMKTSDEFASNLLEKEMIAVVPGSGFGADDYIRLSYALSLDNIKKGLDRIEKFVNSY